MLINIFKFKGNAPSMSPHVKSVTPPHLSFCLVLLTRHKQKTRRPVASDIYCFRHISYVSIDSLKSQVIA